mmetsp:Transcript_3324/g.8441  ORF Transcript_3324/g.8441 Transcript_3324/m.8441 type:complete len:255 (-) Transcript_3324:95-859(-)
MVRLRPGAHHQLLTLHRRLSVRHDLIRSGLTAHDECGSGLDGYSGDVSRLPWRQQAGLRQRQHAQPLELPLGDLGVQAVDVKHEGFHQVVGVSFLLGVAAPVANRPLLRAHAPFLVAADDAHRLPNRVAHGLAAALEVQHHVARQKARRVGLPDVGAIRAWLGLPMIAKGRAFIKGEAALAGPRSGEYCLANGQALSHHQGHAHCNRQPHQRPLRDARRWRCHAGGLLELGATWLRPQEQAVKQHIPWDEQRQL